MTDRIRACIDCAADITGRHGNAKRCAPCSTIAAKVAWADARPSVTPCRVDDDECVPGRLRGGYCQRHYSRMRHHGDTSSPRIDNLHRYTVDDNGCWLWDGPTYSNGYAKATVEIHGTRLAHRVFYIEHRGPVPDGLDLDHLCRVRRCVNPAHLEPVDRSANLVRGHAARTLCEAGLHDITLPGAVKLGTFQCVECWRIRYQQAKQVYRAKGA